MRTGRSPVAPVGHERRKPASDIITPSIGSCKQIEVLPITPSVQHGEGPHWDPVDEVLYFVDSFKATVLRWNPYLGVKSFKLKNRNFVGPVIPVANQKNQLLVAADRTLEILNYDEQEIVSEIISIEKGKERNQFNDGKADVYGNIWLGTLTRREDLGVDPRGGSFYRVKFDNGTVDVEEKIENTSISNGVAWTKDNKKLYYIDSDTRYVVGYDTELESGKICNPKIVFDLADHPELSGIPDGMTIDTDDVLWIALFGGGHVIQVDPTDGRLLRAVPLPVTYVTSVEFGGPRLDVLYVTTSKLKLSKEELAKEPLAGSVFALSGLEVVGKSSPRVKM